MSYPIEALPGNRKKGGEPGRTILLDMDGVVADFVSAACVLFGKDPRAEHSRLTSERGWNFFADWGYTPTDFWAGIDRAGEDFWIGIKPEPWASHLYDGLRTLAPVYFCSSAALTPSAWSGKIKWLREFVGIGHFNDVVLTTHKHLLARPTNCLIDDNQDNIDAFERFGGKTILFPRLWNKRGNKGHPDEIIEEVRQWLA